MFSLGPAGHSHNRTVHHALFPLMTRITRLEFSAVLAHGCSGTIRAAVTYT